MLHWLLSYKKELWLKIVTEEKGEEEEDEGEGEEEEQPGSEVRFIPSDNTICKAIFVVSVLALL
jgi:hypothetical protein